MLHDQKNQLSVCVAQGMQSSDLEYREILLIFLAADNLIDFSTLHHYSGNIFFVLIYHWFYSISVYVEIHVS